MKTSTTWLLIAVFFIVGISTYIYFTKQKEETIRKEQALVEMQENHFRELRNSWARYIYPAKTEYVFSSLGGIDQFNLPIQNNTDYMIDEVDVEVSYIKTSGGVYKTETIAVQNIPPHTAKSGIAPKSTRGTSVDFKIVQVYCRSLNLCYPSGSRNFSDPYFCK
jgi:hypothetical protein